MAHEVTLEISREASTSSVFLQVAIALRTKRLSIQELEFRHCNGEGPHRIRIVLARDHADLSTFLEHLHTIPEATRITHNPSE